MKKFKKIAALLLAMVMTIAMAVPAMAHTNTNITNTDKAKWTSDVTVSNVAKETTAMNAYKIVQATYANGVMSYSLTTFARTALEKSIGEGKTYADEAAVLKKLGVETEKEQTDTVDQKTDKNADKNAILSVLMNAITNSTTKDYTATGLTAYIDSTNKLVPANAEQTATFKNVKVGSYLVVAADAVNVYNPMMISVGLTADDAGKLDDVLANNTVAKYSSVDVDKKILKTTDGDGNEDTNQDKEVGDSVPFEITTTIPNYDTVTYKNITFKITDTLDAGLTAPEAKAITVKVGNTTISPVNEVAASYKKDGETKYYVTVNGQIITIDLSFIAKEHIGEKVTVTYSAKLNASATTGFEANKNSVYLTYSNAPNSETNTETKTTYTYSFSIDGKILGETVGEELKKTGEGTWTRIDDDSIASQNKALKDAQFTLYEDEDCTDAVEVKGKNPYTTLEDGKITFEGLDGNKVYYLKETKAPSGYSINDTVNKIKFVLVEYDTDGQMTKYTVEINGVTKVTYELKTDKAGSKYVDATYRDTSTVTYTNQTKNEDVTETVNTTEIKNTKLTSLPSTGGIGTTIFTIAGCVIMIAAGGMLIVSRRKKNA